MDVEDYKMIRMIGGEIVSAINRMACAIESILKILQEIREEKEADAEREELKNHG